MIAIELLELVDRLEALVSGGWHIPFTVKTAVDENALYDIVDQMRVAIPQAMKQANEIIQQKEKVLAAAEDEAELIIEKAQQKAARLLDEHEIIAAARAQAESIKAQAQREADEIRRGADEYSMNALSELESRLGALLRTTSNGLETLRRRRMQTDSEQQGRPPEGIP